MQMVPAGWARDVPHPMQPWFMAIYGEIQLLMFVAIDGTVKYFRGFTTQFTVLRILVFSMYDVNV